MKTRHKNKPDIRNGKAQVKTVKHATGGTDGKETEKREDEIKKIKWKQYERCSKGIKNIRKNVKN